MYIWRVIKWQRFRDRSVFFFQNSCLLNMQGITELFFILKKEKQNCVDFLKILFFIVWSLLILFFLQTGEEYICKSSTYVIIILMWSYNAQHIHSIIECSRCRCEMPQRSNRQPQTNPHKQIYIFLKTPQKKILLTWAGEQEHSEPYNLFLLKWRMLLYTDYMPETSYGFSLPVILLLVACLSSLIGVRFDEVRLFSFFWEHQNIFVNK